MLTKLPTAVVQHLLTFIGLKRYLTMLRFLRIPPNFISYFQSRSKTRFHIEQYVPLEAVKIQYKLNVNFIFMQNVMQDCCKYNRVDVLNFLIENGHKEKMYAEMIYEAAKYNNFEMFVHLIELRFNLVEEELYEIFASSNLKIVKYLMEEYKYAITHENEDEVLKNVCLNEDIEVTKYILDNFADYYLAYKSRNYTIVENLRVDTFMYLYDKYESCYMIHLGKFEISGGAALINSLLIYRIIQKNTREIITELCKDSKKIKNVRAVLYYSCYYCEWDNIEYLLNNFSVQLLTVSCGKRALYFAAQEGHIEIVKLLIEKHKVKATMNAYNKAKKNKRDRVVDYLRKYLDVE